MSIFGNITFLAPGYFLLIIPVFIALVFLYLKKEKATYFSGFADLQKVYGGHALFYNIFFVLLFCISLNFVSLLAHPVSYSSEKKIHKNGIDIQVVLDLSYSMIAEDLSPNRLEVAKQVLGDFIDTRESDRVGLVLFSGVPFTSIPLSFDYDFISGYVDDISIDTIDRNYGQLSGTAIGDGLLLAYDGLISDEKHSEVEKIMILITDGEANSGIDPISAIKIIKDANIKTYTIGVGGLEETYIDYVDPLGFSNRLPIGGIDEDTLRKIATETGGKYYRATSSEGLQDIFDTISNLEKSQIEQSVVEIREDRYMLFLYMFVLQFLLLMFIIYRKDIHIG